MAQYQDTFASDLIATHTGSEVADGTLRNTDQAGAYVATFNGTSSYARKAISDYRSGDTAGSMVARIKWGGTTNSPVLASNDEASTSSRVWIWIMAGGEILIGTRDIVEGVYDRLDTTSGAVPTDEWCHIAVTTDGSTTKAYVDGVEQALTAGSGSNRGEWFGDVTARDNVVVGGVVRGGSSFYFDGQIDEVAVYSTAALSADEVRTITEQGVDTGHANIVNYWKCDDNGNLADSVGSDTLTATSITWSTTEQPHHSTKVEALSGDEVVSATSIDDWKFTPAEKSGGAIAKLALSTDSGVTHTNYDSDDLTVGGLPLDGVADYAYAADHNDFSFTDGAGNDQAGSISAWVYSNDYASGSNQELFSKADQSPYSAWEYRCVVTKLGSLQFQCVNPSATIYIGRKANEYMGQFNGQWVHVVVTYSGNEANSGIKIYVNGTRVDDVNVSGGSYTGMTNGNARFDIGCLGSIDSASNFLDGTISDVRIWSSELSAANVLALYEDHDNVDSGNLVAHWPLNDTTDETGNGHTLTLVSTSLSTALIDRPVVGEHVGDSNVLELDGVNDRIQCGDIAAMDGASTLTLSFWGKREAGDLLAVQKYSSTSSRIAFGPFSDDLCYGNLSNGTVGQRGTFPAPTDTDWHHYALVFDGGLSGNANRLKMFLDGVQQTLTFNGTIQATTASNAGQFEIGTTVTTYTTGTIANVVFYTSARTAAQVMAEAMGAPPSSPESYWKINEGTGTSIADSGTASNTGTLTGSGWTNDLRAPLRSTAQVDETLTGYGSATKAAFRYQVDAEEYWQRASLTEVTIDYSVAVAAGFPFHRLLAGHGAA